MNVIHINTLTSGGAAKAAIRQHMALLKAGVNSEILFLYGCDKNIPHSNLFNLKPSLIKRIFRKLHLLKSQYLKNEELRHNIIGDFEIVSFPWSDFRIDLHDKVKNADIINLHWVANFLDYPTFFKNIKKPIVWTLHDMNPLLGLYHYSTDELASGGLNAALDAEVKKIKHASIKPIHKLEFVTPSRWLLEEVANHPFLNHYSSHHVPNSLNVDTFHLYDKFSVRNELGLPSDKKILLFVSDYIHNRRKGYDLLTNALNHIDSDDVVLCTLGNDNDVQIPAKYSLKALGLIEDEVTLAKVYNAADVFVLPSRQDNLPNVMLESLACGTPVISFNLGGMKEVIQHNKNGKLAKDLNVNELAIVIEQFFKHGVLWSREEIRNYAVEKFSPHIQTSSLLKIYNSLLN